MNKYHIKKKTSLHNTDVWTDFKSMIAKVFIERPAEVRSILPEILKELIIANYGDKYKPADILKLITNGYKKPDGNFQFKSEDFIV